MDVQRAKYNVQNLNKDANVVKLRQQKRSMYDVSCSSYNDRTKRDGNKRWK